MILSSRRVTKIFDQTHNCIPCLRWTWSCIHTDSLRAYLHIRNHQWYNDWWRNFRWKLAHCIRWYLIEERTTGCWMEASQMATTHRHMYDSRNDSRWHSYIGMFLVGFHRNCYSDMDSKHIHRCLENDEKPRWEWKTIGVLWRTNTAGSSGVGKSELATA